MHTPSLSCFARRMWGLVAAHLMSAATVWGGPAQLPDGFIDVPLAAALPQPVALALVPDGSAPQTRIVFVEQKTARIRLLVGSSLRDVGTVPDVETAGGERGLLGVAVDPRFPSSPYVYMHATDRRGGGQVVISRFTLSGDLEFSGSGDLDLVANSRYDLLTGLPDDASHHNGGTVRFGPDGMLYASLGDDGASCNAQNLAVLAGKILRLDVTRLPAGSGGPAPYALLVAPGNPFAAHPDSAARLVRSFGLRNPFRFHIDAANGALFVADVGQNEWEELNRFATGGENAGWPWREGPEPYISCGGQAPATVSPIAWYGHGEGAAIVSAGVYRRPPTGAARFPSEYDGDVFFIDYYTGFMRRIRSQGGNWVTPPPETGQPSADDWATGMNAVSDVLAMPDGALVYVRQAINYAASSGEIRRIAFQPTTGVPRAAARTLTLAPPRPSPGRGPVVLAWTQPQEADVRLDILDISGRVVRTLAPGVRLGAGTHERTWDGVAADGAAAPPGVYIARLEAGGTARTAKITRLR